MNLSNLGCLLISMFVSKCALPDLKKLELMIVWDLIDSLVIPICKHYDSVLFAHDLVSHPSICPLSVQNIIRRMNRELIVNNGDCDNPALLKNVSVFCCPTGRFLFQTWLRGCFARLIFNRDWGRTLFWGESDSKVYASYIEANRSVKST